MKDTNNILPYGIWSGGDYTGISTESNNNISNNWSKIGEYSIIKTNENPWITLYQDSSLTNKTLTLSASINTDLTGSLCIYYRVNGTYKSIKSGFNKINGDVSVSAEIPSDTTLVWCRIDLGTSNGKIYADNISLTSS